MKKLFLSLATTLITIAVLAQVPETMHFQGFLTDPATGAAKPDGNFDLVFSIYDDPVSGFQYWSETHNGVSVSGGLFDVVLGSQGTPLSIAFDIPYWLEVSVDGETLSPRYELATTAYAFTAKTAETALEVVGVDNIFPGTGNVGIGTSSPQRKLQVIGNALITNGRLELQETSSASEGGELLLAYADANPAIPTGFIVDAFNDGVNNQLRFFNPSITMMFLDDDGDLDVTGSVRANSFIGDGSALTNLPATSAVWSGSPDISYSGGNVGIGTTTPFFPLDIQGNSASTIYARIKNDDPIGFAGYRLTNDINQTYVLSLGGSTNATAPNSLSIYDITALETRFLINQSGNVGIGTVTPEALLHIEGGGEQLRLQNYSGGGGSFPSAIFYGARGTNSLPTQILNNDILGGFFFGGHDGTDFGASAFILTTAVEDFGSSKGTSINFGTDEAGDGTLTIESRMIIMDDGRVGIGTITPDRRFYVQADQSTAAIAKIENTSANVNSDGMIIQLVPSSPGGSSYFIEFHNDGGMVGSIENTGSGVNFNMTSDVRLKDDIKDLNGVLDLMEKIQPRSYKFKSHPSVREYGFIAQELQKVYPQAVSGDPNGDVETDPMMVDYSKLTPLLTAAIKEQQEIIETQESDITELKSELEVIKAQLERLTTIIEAEAKK